MDNVLVDFVSAFKHLTEKQKNEFKNNMDDIDGIFSLMEPIPKAIESYNKIIDHFDVYILSTSPWDNDSAWTDKIKWVKKYIPKAYKNLILSHNKHLNVGDYIIDDRTANGVDKFSGEHIHFGTEGMENWDKVLEYLFRKENIIL
ncbi:5' nucleotidase, deoxy (Pyrimidine), type C protein (NT5C) [Ulvibacter litoralis]|uniref:5' nucleotidase, deoxy (Pyrimidine), type C protein (NT5C) n=2 Tax=Ulvibacter litoralis TaxID=227084 RepID=A0A1G7HFH0_9FLAO|nr:5' nucleotidase, deoxy (Pyrimidine), type C protein (NT5C) [Ulvibacter litoralis]